MESVRTRLPILLIFIVPALVLWRAIFLGEAIGPFDDVRAMMAGHATPHVWDVLQADAVLQFYGWRDMVFDAWGRFEFPLWNHHQLMGTPLLANSQSAGFYPPHILIGILKIPTALGITILAYVHLVWAGLGARALSKKLGACEEGAVASGILLAACPFMVSWIGLASVITTASWMPWAILAALNLASHDPRWKTVFTLGICVGMMILGGHLQFAAYGMVAVVVVALWQTLFSRVHLGSLACLGGIAVGGLIAAPQLMPILEFSKSSHRTGSPSQDGYIAYTSSAIKPFELQGLAFPQLLGVPGEEIQGLDSQIKMPTYWPGYVKRGANYAESALFLGPLILLLLCGIRWAGKWRQDASIVAVGVVGLLLALGTPLNALFYFYVPGWSSTGSPGRAEILFVIAACCLASLGWPDGKNKKRETIRWGIFAVVCAACLWVNVMARQSLTGYQVELDPLFKAASSQAFLSAIPAIGLVILFTALFWFLVWKRRDVLALVIVCVCTLLIAGPKILPTSKVPWQKSDNDPSTRIAFINENWELTIGVPVSVPPNIATAQGLIDIGGYDSLMHKETTQWLDKINGEKMSPPPANGNMMFIKPGADEKLLSESGVSQIWSLSNYALEGGGKLIKRNLGGPGRASINGKPAKIVEDTYSTQKVSVTGPGKLIVRDRNMPGWKVTLDGKSTFLDGSMWREVEIPTGEHEVIFKYEPPGLSMGLWLGIVGVILGFLALLPGRYDD